MSLALLYQLNLESAGAAAPTLVSATIAADGDSISILLSESVTIGAGGNGGFVLTPSGGASTATYSSGDTTDTLVYTLSRTIDYGETITLAYTQPGSGVEASDDQQDLATFSGEEVANGSLINVPAGSASRMAISIGIRV
jgi:hypothetical protein